MTDPPERIEVAAAGIVLRRHRPDDVETLHAAIEASRDHLRPWMPWADQDYAGTADFVARVQQFWTAGEDYSYLVVDEVTGELLGGCGLHRRSKPESIEIGYWLRPEAAGRGVITAAAGRLTDVAFSLDGVERVEIRCDEANVRSAAIPLRLGFTLEGTVDVEAQTPAATGRHQIWVRDGAGGARAPGRA